MFNIQEVELEWIEEDGVGGIRAPVEIFVQHIILALSEEQQKYVIDAVAEEVARRNEILAGLKDEDLEE